jgi:ABC-type transporter Mla subunit MlaD
MSPIVNDRVKLELKRATGPFLLFALLCVAGLLTGADILRNLAGDKPWVSYVKYRVAFQNVEGVVPGRHELRIDGVKAGSITASKLVDGTPVMTLNVEKRYAPVYRDARVRIRPVTPLEDMYVDIESRGHARAGKLKTGDNGDILPVAQTQSMVEIGRVLNVLDVDARARLAALLTQLGTGLNDNGAQLRAAFAEIAPFLRTAQSMGQALSQRRQNIARLVHNFGAITQVLAQRDKQLGSFVTSGDAVLTTLAQNDVPLSSTLSELPPTLASMRGAFAQLRGTEDVLDPALRELQPAAAALPDGLAALDRFARDANPAIAALRPAVRSLRPLARTVRPTAGSLATAFEDLKPETPQIDRITALAVPCLDKTSLFLSRLMSITKFGDTPNNVGNARANARVMFGATDLVKDPSWFIEKPCMWTATARGGKP